jgi:type VI secretion system protein ImpL
VKGFLKAFLRLLLWVLLLAILCAGVFFACRLFFGLPATTSAVACLVPVVLLLAGLLVYRLVVRRRRNRQLRRIVSLDPGLADNTPQERKLLENRWTRAVSILRTSYLGRFGNPLYALPWYMVMGKSGSGKTSAINRCGLNAMLTDVSPQQERAGTRNCDWFFFRETVVLDTAGRYAVPQNEGADDAEWREFLLQLAKYRRREPLNGLIVTVAADTLSGDGSRLLGDARCLRRRLDEVMRILGAKFPVYLMITKIDLPAGMARVLEGLPPVLRDQCAGRIIQSPDRKELVPVSVQIERAWYDILNHFRQFCLYRDNGGQPPEAQRILAWEELKAMTPALKAFAVELFAENPYQETPFLRGIFFSSALRGDAEKRSAAFPRLDALLRRARRTPENVRGMFLHDFFAKVLPGDRNLYRPVAEYLRWRSSVRLFAYALMLIVPFGISSLTLLSFRHNESVMQEAVPPRRPAPGADIIASLLAYEQNYRDAARLEREAAAHSLPSMGFSHAEKALAVFNRTLNTAFDQDVLNTADRIMEERRSKITPDTPDEEVFTLAADLIWRFDTANGVLQGKSLEDLLAVPAMPQGILSSLQVDKVPLLAPAVAYSMAVRYHTTSDMEVLRQSLRSMRASLARLPKLKPNSLQWIARRAGSLSMLSPLPAGVFWPGNAQVLDTVRLDPAYTGKGFKATLDYLNNLTLIVDTEDLQPDTRDFLRWYAGSFAEAWRVFLGDFVRTMLDLAPNNRQGAAMTLMSSRGNPFFAAALRADEELAPVRPYLDPLPDWVNDLAVWAEALRMENAAKQEQQQPTVADRVRLTARKFYSEFDSQLDTEDGMRRAKAVPLVKDVDDYLNALHDLVRYTVQDDTAFIAVQDAMPDEKNKNSPSAALNLAKTVSLTMLNGINTAQDEDSPVLLLGNGPLTYFTTALVNAAACRIQAMWEGTVLAKAGAAVPAQLQQALFAEQGGLARDFADKTLAYYLEPTINGYTSQAVNGVSVPFAPEFLHFLNAGTLGYRPMPQEYAVTVDAVPVDVNDDALEKPYASILSLSCARDKQELVNYNSPASRRFTWQRDGCGDTRLSVAFKSLTLDVLYAGEGGFVGFLNDFQYGSKTFTPQDFPDREAVLKKLGVREITLRYKLSGADAVLRGASYTPGTLPFVAAECRR